jgi:RNA polymerase sigma-70 factor (ECF subfamily)
MARDVPSREAELVERARNGDVGAFGRLVEASQDYIYNAVFHMVGDDQDAADITQEVFMRAFRKLDRFEGRARFTTWAYGIMLNCVRSHWRRTKRRTVLPLASDSADGDSSRTDPAADTAGPVEAAERREKVEDVRTAIAALDEDLREIIVLRDIEGLSYEELGNALELEAGTVKSRLHRARQALRQKLEPLYGPAV